MNHKKHTQRSRIKLRKAAKARASEKIERLAKKLTPIFSSYIKAQMSKESWSRRILEPV